MSARAPRALITGITGQDGAYLARLLLEEGYQVFGTVRDSTRPNLANLEAVGVMGRVELRAVNLLDLSNLVAVLEAVRPQEIYNLASQSSVGRSFEQPIGTVEFNTLSTLNLLEAMRLSRSQARFYQASSSEMFGRAARLPVDEQTAMHPVSPYGVSKAAAHWIAVNYRETYGLFCACGILFNHESALRAPHFVTKKILSAAVDIARGRRVRLRLGNLEVARDWGYAPHYVRAMWLMLQQDQPRDYVIATRRAHTLRQFARRLFACLDLELEEHLEIDPSLYRPSELEVIYGDPARARRELGWDYDLDLEGLVARLVEDEMRLRDTGRVVP